MADWNVMGNYTPSFEWQVVSGSVTRPTACRIEMDWEQAGTPPGRLLVQPLYRPLGGQDVYTRFLGKLSVIFIQKGVSILIPLDFPEVGGFLACNATIQIRYQGPYPAPSDLSVVVMFFGDEIIS